MIACGTAYYAGLVAKYWFEQMARCRSRSISRPSSAIATPLPEGGAGALFQPVGRDGGHAGRLALCQAEGQHIARVVNVAESSMAREADAVLPTHAGPEIGVASTKAFTTQLDGAGLPGDCAAKARGHDGARGRASRA